MLLAAVPMPALAWGAPTHRLIAEMAYHEVSGPTRHAMRALLRDRHEVETPECRLRKVGDLGTWADCVRNLDAYKATASWHYQDISVCGDFDVAAGCPNGECVTTIIPREAAILADDTRPRAERLKALAFVVHFVGDLHQPLHVGEKADRGGNQVPVDYLGEASDHQNLHHIWDSEIPEAATAVRPRLTKRSVKDADIAAWSGGGVADWARESWAASRDTAYGALHGFADRCVAPSGPPPTEPHAVVDAAYVATAEPVARARIVAAAVRLTAVLDGALDPGQRGGKPAR